MRSAGLHARGLRTRSAAAFAVMALVVSGALSVVVYELARWYLLDKREELAFRQATLNAVAIKGQIAAGAAEADDLIAALQTSDARALLRFDGTWYTAVVQFGESAVPQSLSQLVAAEGAAHQRLVVDGQPYLAYGFVIPDVGAEYYEFVSAAEYERTLSVLAVILLIAASITTIGGATAGWFVSRRVLRPLATVAESARSISDGDLSHRIDVGDDPDLRVMATAFNEMAGNVEARIEREHRFTADVSHELRTPLTALGAAVSLARRADLTERGTYAIDILEQELQHFTRLTVELLEISRIDAGISSLECNDVDVVAIARRVMTQAGVDQGVLRVEQEPLEWRLDPTRIERVLANLIENAQRYAGGVTEISIAVQGEVLVIAVDDAGPGVPTHERSAIFGRFNRGSIGQPQDKPKGTGLGLALVEEHVRMHGGETHVGDSPLGGARFVVRVPRSP
jgi:two-component system sensor histidine kinase MtrB